mgnify:CR=1 FL=1
MTVTNRKADIESAFRKFLEALGPDETEKVRLYVETHPEFPKTIAQIVSAMVRIKDEQKTVSELVNEAGHTDHHIPLH